jgi:secondary thiamine-phosphate synthase enzyme
MWRTRKRPPLHFRDYEMIGKKFDNFVLARTRAFCHSLLHVEARSLKAFTEHLWFEVPNRRGFINITPKIEELVHRSGVTEGLCLVNAMHITASVFINDDEQGLHHDYEAWLEKLAPHAPTSAYRHNLTGEDNADAHLKRQIMGREVVVAITKGKLDFGPWEQIFYGEFDGRRRKRVLIKIIGD